jgi:hypothetical protein
MCTEGVAVDVDLHDSRRRADQRAVPHRPHVQRAAPPDHEIGTRDQLGRKRRREPPGHVKGPRVVVEKALGHRAGREQGSGLLCEPTESIPARRRSRPSTGHEHRSSCRREKRPHGVEVGCGWRSRWRRRDRLDVDGRRHRISLQTERKVEQHGAAFDLGDPVGRGGCAHRAVSGLDRQRGGPDGFGEGGLVDEEVRPRFGHAGRDHDHRRPALGRLGDPGHRVGQPAALVESHDADRAAHPRVRVGHRGGPAFVPGCDKVHAMSAQGVRDVEVPRADHPERLPDPERAQRRRHHGCDVDLVRHDCYVSAQRSTRASTRAGLPEPRTIFSGDAIRTVP